MCEQSNFVGGNRDVIGGASSRDGDKEVISTKVELIVSGFKLIRVTEMDFDNHDSLIEKTASN